MLKDFPNIIVISDEIYEHINFTSNNCSIGEFLSTKDQVVTVNGLSKGFAMTGWRLGYLGAPKKLLMHVLKFKGNLHPAHAQLLKKAALATLSKNPDFTLKMKNEFENRRDLVLNLISEIPEVKKTKPEGAFYMFLDFSNYFNKISKEKKLLIMMI